MAIDEGAHRLAARREDGDHPAVERGDDGPDLAAQRAQCQIDHMFAALLEIRMREFEESRHQVEAFDTQRRQVAVRIELGSDEHIGADHGADPREEIAFRVVIALRDHRAVQAEHHGVDRQRGLKLAEDAVAQRLVGLALDEARRLRPAAGALDDGEAFRAATPAQDRHDGGAERRRIRMFARPGEERRLEGVHVGRDRRECVGFRGQRGREDAHVLSIRSLVSMSGSRRYGQSGNWPLRRGDPQTQGVLSAVAVALAERPGGIGPAFVPIDLSRSCVHPSPVYRCNLFS